MIFNFVKFSVRAILSVVPESAMKVMAKSTFGLIRKGWFKGWLTDKFMEVLLHGMDVMFLVSPAYRENLKNYNAKYLFATDDGKVAVSAIFQNNEMRVEDEAIGDWDTRVTFKNPAALRKFLFSEDQDVLNSILANEVTVSGNLNDIFRFGFLARDLQHRLL